MTALARTALALTIALGGCVNMTADQPLTVALGQRRAATETDLHQHQYCRKNADPPQRQEVYPRCDRPGTEYGDSWVTATYEKDRLVELRRWERYADDQHAIERWNQLVGERSKLTPPSDEAANALRKRGLLQEGTRTVRAFRIDAQTIVGVYLLTPSPPENAAILEKIAYVGEN
jgi:hypothetical protein